MDGIIKKNTKNLNLSTDIFWQGQREEEKKEKTYNPTKLMKTK